MQTTAPSWLYSVAQGATTIWESWNGIDENGNPHNSLNHYSYGAVVGWLFESVLGIMPEPVDNRFIINPKPHPLLKWAEGAYDSIIGRLSVKWEYKENHIEFDINVPPNTTAELCFNGKSFTLNPGKHIVKEENNAGI